MPAKKSAEAQAVGAAMRSLRRERGIAQEAFAARARLDRSFYGAVERGEFNITLATVVTPSGHGQMAEFRPQAHALSCLGRRR